MSTVSNKKPWKNVNNNSGNVVTTTSYTNLTGLSYTFKCSGRRPVLVKLIERSAAAGSYVSLDLGAGSTGAAYLRVVVTFPISGSTSAETAFARNWGVGVVKDTRKFPLSFCEWIVYPQEGICSFTVQGMVSASGLSLTLGATNLFVVEL